MPDYAGAVAAIQQRLKDNWTTTPIALQNETPDREWPPVNESGEPQPFVYFEVIGNTSGLRAGGLPGSQVWLYEGHLLAHVFVPGGSGTTLAQQYAAAIGEIFRAKAFYRDEAAGAEVRTWSPMTDGGASDADNGNYFRVTCVVPFEFYYRG